MVKKVGGGETRAAECVCGPDQDKQGSQVQLKDNDGMFMEVPVVEDISRDRADLSGVAGSCRESVDLETKETDRL